MADDYGPVQSGQVSPLLKNRRTINATLEATRSFQRTRRPGGQFPFENPPGSLFVANLTEATGAASWQARTLVSGAWADDDPTGTNDAYPVQCGGAAFTPGSTATSIIWEEPAGSGNYAFLPIQYASTTVPGFVSTAAQSFNGLKTFQDGVQIGDGSTGCVSTVYFKPDGASVIPFIRHNGSTGFDAYLVGLGDYFTLVGDGDTAYRVNLSGTTYTGVTDSDLDGLEVTGGLITGGSINFPDAGSYLTTVGIQSPGGSLTIGNSPLTAPGGYITLDTIGASGTDPDGGAFTNGRCTSISTLGGITTSWVVAVGDTVLISNGRIQSITPGT